jgi:hypothetical protein
MRYMPLVSVSASGTGVHDRFVPRWIADHVNHEVEIFSEHDLEAVPFKDMEPAV